MESSSYQTAFVVWDIPSPHSNHSDVLLTTFILHCPQGLAKLPGFPKQVLIALLELSELALHGPTSWPTSGSLNLPVHQVWGCALLLQGLTARIQLVLTKTFQRIMSVWKGLHKYHTRCDVLGDQGRWCFLSSLLEAMYNLKTASVLLAENRL